MDTKRQQGVKFKTSTDRKDHNLVCSLYTSTKLKSCAYLVKIEQNLTLWHLFDHIENHFAIEMYNSFVKTAC